MWSLLLVLVNIQATAFGTQFILGCWKGGFGRLSNLRFRNSSVFFALTVEWWTTSLASLACWGQLGSLPFQSKCGTLSLQKQLTQFCTLFFFECSTEDCNVFTFRSRLYLLYCCGFTYMVTREMYQSTLQSTAFFFKASNINHSKLHQLLQRSPAQLLVAAFHKTLQTKHSDTLDNDKKGGRRRLDC